MNCPLQTNEGAEYILDYCAGRLEAARLAGFERHVADCAECRQVVDAQRTVWNALDEFEPMEISQSFDRRLYARIEADSQRSWWQRLADGPALGWSSLMHWKPAATLAACGAMLVVGLYLRPGSEQISGPVGGQDPVYKADTTVERPAVDVDQIESTIEDLDMLKQLGVVDSEKSGA